MSPIACHVVVRLTDNRVLAPTRAVRRELARAVLRIAEEFPLLAFCFADTHLHLLVACDEAEARELARRIEISLQRRLQPDVACVPAWARPVTSQAHLANAFRYILGQDARHGSHADPLHDGSNLPDLLGMRVLGGRTIAAVRSYLPRLERADLLALLGVPELEPVAGPLGLLADAAAAAVGLPHLRSQAPEAAGALAAAVHLARPHHSQTQIAQALGRTTRTVRNLQALPPDPRLVRAVGLQLGARVQLLATGRLDSEVRLVGRTYPIGLPTPQVAGEPSPLLYSARGGLHSAAAPA